MSYKLSIGERIDDLIHEKGITVDKLSKELGISTGTISGLTNNNDKNYGYKNFIKLAKYFNVSVEYLLGISDVKTLDKDVKFVCQYTGLSEKNVKFLHRNFSDKIELDLSRDFSTEQINNLIEDNNFFFLIDKMTDYARSLANLEHAKKEYDINDINLATLQERNYHFNKKRELIHLKNLEEAAEYASFKLQKIFIEIAKNCAHRYNDVLIKEGDKDGNN